MGWTWPLGLGLKVRTKNPTESHRAESLLFRIWTPQNGATAFPVHSPVKPTNKRGMPKKGRK